MLIGCITGPDFETAKIQVEKANRFCDGFELRVDLIEEGIEQLFALGNGVKMITDPSDPLRWLYLEPEFLTVDCEFLKSIPKTNSKIIRSYHNFKETPQNLDKILEKMPPGDSYKIACHANCTTDSLRMLEFVKNKNNISGICMGPFGQITRILGPKVGNVFDFCALGKEAAPGQLQIEELLDRYHYKQISPKTSVFGLIGNPTFQSPSHITHNAFFKKNGLDAVYVKMLLNSSELSDFFPLAQKIFLGLSVTIPFKEKVLDFVDELELDAKEIGAVNTITFTNSQVLGANTDAKASLENLEVRSKHIVILGAGGSAKAICYEAKRRGAKVTVLSRNAQKAKELSSSFGTFKDLTTYDILINTTPNPNPVPLKQSNKIVMDISLPHKNSQWLQRAKELDCQVVTGEKMFQNQAMGQFARWFRNVSSLECSLPLHS